MLDAKQVQAVFDIIWPQQDWNGGDEGFCRAVAGKVVRALQAVGPEPAVAGVETCKFYHSQWPVEDRLKARGPYGLITDDGEAWRYEYTHSDADGGPYDVVCRPRSALVATPPAEQHPDEIAVDCFAAAMKAKLKWEREQRNRSGWQAMSAADLSRILYEHLPKGDPVDVANLSMMLHQNGQQIETPPAEPVVEDWREIEQHVQPRLADGYTAVAISKPGFWMVKGPGPASALATNPAVKDDETVVEALRTEADNAYCRFLDKMSAPLCLGVEYKLATGKFGAAELNAHVDARELYGFHRGINHALAALAATEGQNG